MRNFTLCYIISLLVITGVILSAMISGWMSSEYLKAKPKSELISPNIIYSKKSLLPLENGSMLLPLPDSLDVVRAGKTSF